MQIYQDQKDRLEIEEELDTLIAQIFDALSHLYTDNYEAEDVKNLLTEATRKGLFEKVRRIVC